MNDLVVREYQWITLQPGEIGYLDRMSATLPLGCMEWGRRDQVRFAGFCGLVSLGTRMVEILPKAAGQSALVRMIQRVYDFRITSWESGHHRDTSGTLLDVFIAGFCRQLEELLPRGLVHRYVDREEVQSTLRGKLNLPAQLRRSPSSVLALSCRYAEFQADNLVNRVIKATLKRLLRWARSSRLRGQLRLLEGTFVDVTDGLPNVIPWDTLTVDRIAVSWRPLLTQCRWILEGTAPSLSAGPRAGLSLLFDMEKLFEAFIAKELQAVFNARGIRVLAQRPRRYLITDASGQDIFQMKPDLTIQRDGENLAILDTKWKRLGDGKKQGVFQSDLYQLFTYAKSYGVSQVALIYPTEDTAARGASAENWDFKEGNVNIWIHRVDLGQLDVGLRHFRENGLWTESLDSLLTGARLQREEINAQPSLALSGK